MSRCGLLFGTWCQSKIIEEITSFINVDSNGEDSEHDMTEVEENSDLEIIDVKNIKKEMPDRNEEVLSFTTVNKCDRKRGSKIEIYDIDSTYENMQFDVPNTSGVCKMVLCDFPKWKSILKKAEIVATDKIPDTDTMIAEDKDSLMHCKKKTPSEFCNTQLSSSSVDADVTIKKLHVNINNLKRGTTIAKDKDPLMYCKKKTPSESYDAQLSSSSGDANVTITQLLAGINNLRRGTVIAKGKGALLGCKKKTPSESCNTQLSSSSGDASVTIKKLDVNINNLKRGMAIVEDRDQLKYCKKKTPSESCDAQLSSSSGDANVTITQLLAGINNLRRGTVIAEDKDSLMHCKKKTPSESCNTQLSSSSGDASVTIKKLDVNINNLKRGMAIVEDGDPLTPSESCDAQLSSSSGDANVTITQLLAGINNLRRGTMIVKNEDHLMYCKTKTPSESCNAQLSSSSVNADATIKKLNVGIINLERDVNSALISSNINQSEPKSDLIIVKTESLLPLPDSTTNRVRTCIPARKNWKGQYDFNVHFQSPAGVKNSESTFYLKDMDMFYVNKDDVFSVMVSAENAPPDCVIRVMLVFSLAQHASEIVRRCPDHSSEDAFRGILEHEHVIQSVSDEAIYDRDPITGHYSVVVRYQKPEAGEDFSTYLYKFTCFNSCVGGLNRRPVTAVFTLEKDIQVLGRRSVQIKICACPGRDSKLFLNRFEQNKFLNNYNSKSGEPSRRQHKEENAVVYSNQPSEAYTIAVKDVNLYNFLNEMKHFYEVNKLAESLRNERRISFSLK